MKECESFRQLKYTLLDLQHRSFSKILWAFPYTLTSISSIGSECAVLGEEPGIAVARVDDTGSVANERSDLAWPAQTVAPQQSGRQTLSPLETQRPL